MNGEVNSPNVCQYVPVGEPPNFYYHRPDSHQELTLWAGFCENGEFLGAFFIDGNLNGNTYLQLIIDGIIPQLIEILANQFYFDSGSFQVLWWTQDGAPAQRLREFNNVPLGCFQN